MALSRRLATAIAAAATLAGCTVGPDFHGPPAQSPAPHFAPTPADTPSRTAETPADETWWNSFGDPELSSLITRLAAQNLDLQIAAERIVQARAVRREVASQGLPHVEGNERYVHTRESKNGMVSLLEPAPGAPLEFNQDDATLQASWELDLFGRVRRGVEAASADTQAQLEARHGIMLSAEGDLAQSYMQLRGVQAREAVVHSNLANADARRRLVADRFRNGVATVSDLAQADATAASIGEDMPTLQAQESELVNSLGMLLAEPPRSLEKELTPPKGQPPAPQPAAPPRVPIGLPSGLLRRRPDIREAEARLHSATAQTGVAVAAFYPDVSLTGSYGDESLGVHHLFDAASRMFMVGPSVSLPIFEGGRLRGELQLRRAAEREAALSYRRTVLGAWRDVDDALTAYAEVQHRVGDVRHVGQADQIALRVAGQRYDQGVESYIDVTVAQTAVFRDQDALAQAQTDLEVALVRLYRALGGGWSD